MSLAVTGSPQRDYVSLSAVDAVAVAASDTVADPNGPFYAFYTGAAGDITLVTLQGNTVLLTAVPIGKYDIGFTRVFSTGTAHASTIIGLK